MKLLFIDNATSYVEVAARENGFFVVAHNLSDADPDTSRLPAVQKNRGYARLNVAEALRLRDALDEWIFGDRK